MLTRCLVVVDTDALQLQIAVAYVDAIAVNAMLLRYDLPELQRNMKRRKKKTIFALVREEEEKEVTEVQVEGARL